MKSLLPTILIMTCFLLGCARNETDSASNESKVANRAAIPVVLDTDIGSDVDDTWALLHLLRSPELDLKMVLCGTANTEYRARLAAKFLELAGRTDVAVGMGPTGDSSHEYQLPWVGDYQLADYPGPVHRDGVDAFIEMVHASPTPITLIAVGPLPNILEALERDPTIAPKIHFVGMHGSIDRGYGPNPTPETNVRVNVPAFRKALTADWASFQITPLDTCGRVAISGENYQRILHSDDPLVQALIENYRVWADLVTWMEVDFFEERSSTLFDCVAVYMAYENDLLEFETVPISVTDEGMTVRDPENGTPVRTAMHWKDLGAFETHLTNRILGADSE